MSAHQHIVLEGKSKSTQDAHLSAFALACASGDHSAIYGDLSYLTAGYCRLRRFTTVKDRVHRTTTSEGNYDVRGRIVVKGFIADAKATIDLSSYPNSAYTCRVLNGTDRVVGELKIIKSN